MAGMLRKTWHPKMIVCVHVTINRDRTNIYTYTCSFHPNPKRCWWLSIYILYLHFGTLSPKQLDGQHPGSHHPVSLSTASLVSFSPRIPGAGRVKPQDQWAWVTQGNCGMEGATFDPAAGCRHTAQTSSLFSIMVWSPASQLLIRG